MRLRLATALLLTLAAVTCQGNGHDPAPTATPANLEAGGPVWVPVAAPPSPTALRKAPRAATRSRHLGHQPSAAQWARLRMCENGGRYTSKPTDFYRGAYQFDRATWKSVGGEGDPAQASPAEQDLRAKILYADRGRKPWPVCGRWLR